VKVVDDVARVGQRASRSSLATSMSPAEQAASASPGSGLARLAPGEPMIEMRSCPDPEGDYSRLALIESALHFRLTDEGRGELPDGYQPPLRAGTGISWKVRR
jgi:hypothetical protein